MALVDVATVFVRAGGGGDGCVSFHREKYRPRGGPDGGDGGRGGSVILRVSPRVRDLSFLADRPHQSAGDGRPGSGNDRRGGDGRDLVVEVPDGTLVHDERGLVADLVGKGADVVVARGGRGGRGNAALAGPRHRLPRIADTGEPGEEHRLRLELRIVADAGLVGLPNAGKSTLLSRLTAARPKVADYPFTTLTPNLGVAGAEGDTRFVVADIPGLIEGAHEGRGLGHEFLRHVTRCRVLVVIVDLSAPDPRGDLDTVRQELASYDPELAERPQVVAATKADLVEDGTSRTEALGDAVAVSGVTGAGLDVLSRKLRAAMEGAGEIERVPTVVLRPARDRFVVRREGERYRVGGGGLERWVAETDFDDPRQIASLQRRLSSEGVERRLMEVGARRGDEVVIGDRAFEFIPEEEA